MVLVVIAWMVLRPDRIAQIHEVPPELISQVQAVMGTSRPVTSTVSFRFRESADGSLFVRKQLAEPVTPAVLRRNTKRYNAASEIGVLDESTSLSVGPVLLVRHFREPLPLFGDLMPNHFWTTRVLKRFEAKPAARFPGPLGEKFEASLLFESRYANGEVKELEESRLVCTPVERIPAHKVLASLTGEAVKVRCEESGSPNSALMASLSAVTQHEPEMKKAIHHVVTESWYIEDLAMSVQTLFQEELRAGDITSGELSTLRTLERVDVKRSE